MMSFSLTIPNGNRKVRDIGMWDNVHSGYWMFYAIRENGVRDIGIREKVLFGILAFGQLDFGQCYIREIGIRAIVMYPVS
jgi:hypothetical protein